MKLQPRTTTVLALGALLLVTGPASAEPLVTAGPGGLAGGARMLHAAPLPDDAWGDLRVDFSWGRSSALIDDLDVGRFEHRYSIGVPIWNGIEAGIDFRGSRTAFGAEGEEYVYSSFGDVGLQAKYGLALAEVWRLGAAAGYDLPQGVAGLSTVGDVATPWLALLAGWHGDADGTLPLRAHLALSLRYDRTINFLGGTRLPANDERFAWGMRDSMPLLAEIGVEWLLAKRFRPFVEAAVDVPLASETAEIVYRATPGLQVAIWDGLGAGAAADLEFGEAGPDDPARLPWTARVWLSWRVGAPVELAPPFERPDRPEPPVTTTPATDMTEDTPEATPEADAVVDEDGAEAEPAPADDAADEDDAADSGAPAEAEDAAAETEAAAPAPVTPAETGEGSVDLESFELR